MQLGYAIRPNQMSDLIFKCLDRWMLFFIRPQYWGYWLNPFYLEVPGTTAAMSDRPSTWDIFHF